MKISVITLFPEMFSSVFSESIIKRAVDKKLLQISFINLREFGLGKHKLVDDTPYGGGRGMVLRVDVLNRAIQFVKNGEEEKVILLSAHGKQFNQKKAKSFSNLDHLIIICGHYEGFDERVKEYIDEEVSVGDFILTGGEIPAMLIVDSVARLVKGVIKEESAELESFSPYLEHSQYTKPPEYNGQKVPEVLLSGDHKKILEWKRNESLKITKKLRPDLIEKD
ncbi:MAG: tRNA (guanosine(37)-N1)-methyltransferase TrmD [Candidatus Levybacteria bacterium RIFCSPLOWO2_01_FULL_36_13]|nr:MAG: tRNA (guanosine(37)-N1)-methyltransferase TrmD [Candidatus Levybacteria bacterium RIFCSPHIGHO2_01_FULL_36_15b]OGH35495.1 MAG: tRNA (guanosine(37)-N1)-methyltransferase TrmD [Candidatus Levybacteria bacterium RIFCSPLOWO2_01_FULL_36_13]